MAPTDMNKLAHTAAAAEFFALRNENKNLGIQSNW